MFSVKRRTGNKVAVVALDHPEQHGLSLIEQIT
jgi:hypothetical protein